jgi:7,8-dihydropterin-6-yl-methyl-4-(beta-D-ribofuranosyl)aminobenzene 5'-phosphate synthase
MKEPIQVQELRSLSITVITDNYYDALRPDMAIGKRFHVGPGRSVHAEHGLSCHVHTLTDDDKSGSMMFDYGLDGEGVLKNMAAFDIDMEKLSAFGLSHGHFDHWGALPEILARKGSLIRHGTPLYVGKEAFLHRLARLQTTEGYLDLGALDKNTIEALAPLKIVEINEPEEVIPGAYFTGYIDRVTAYEQVPKAFVKELNGQLEPDLFEGEQAIACVVKGKGLVILSGCAHAGIVNTVIRARQMTGVNHLHAIIGGFHLVNAAEDLVEATISDLKAMSPDYIIPTHCTGFEAMVRFSQEMPDQFILNTVGTCYTFGTDKDM